MSAMTRQKVMKSNKDAAAITNSADVATVVAHQDKDLRNPKVKPAHNSLDKKSPRLSHPSPRMVMTVRPDVIVVASPEMVLPKMDNQEKNAPRPQIRKVASRIHLTRFPTLRSFQARTLSNSAKHPPMKAATTTKMANKDVKEDLAHQRMLTLTVSSNLRNPVATTSSVAVVTDNSVPLVSTKTATTRSQDLHVKNAALMMLTEAPPIQEATMSAPEAVVMKGTVVTVETAETVEIVEIVVAKEAMVTIDPNVRTTAITNTNPVVVTTTNKESKDLPVKTTVTTITSPVVVMTTSKDSTSPVVVTTTSKESIELLVKTAITTRDPHVKTTVSAVAEVVKVRNKSPPVPFTASSKSEQPQS